MASVNGINKPKVLRARSAEERLYRQAKAIVKTVEEEKPKWVAEVFDNRAIAAAIPGIQPHHIESLTTELNDIDRLWSVRQSDDAVRTIRRQDRITAYQRYYEAELLRSKQIEERRKLAEEAKKNFNPTDADKLEYLIQWGGASSEEHRRRGMPNDGQWTTIAHCCGTAYRRFGADPTSSEYRMERIRWQYLGEGEEPKLFDDNDDSIRIHDYGSGHDLHLAWTNK